MKILFCKHYLVPQHIYEKREESGSVLLTNGSGSRRQKKNLRIRFRYICGTEFKLNWRIMVAYVSAAL